MPATSTYIGLLPVGPECREHLFRRSRPSYGGPSEPRLLTGFTRDVYFCLSRQAKAGKAQSGKVRAERRSQYALALKAIWLDIDGNKPDKGYGTKAEALAALDKFIKDAKLPFPTAIVDSGNGYHVYWINHEPMEVE